MNNWNVHEILKILNNSGNIALQYYDDPGYELKPDKSIVTDADKTIENYLDSIFNNPSENSYMIGEETILSKNEEYISNALKGNTWIIDPIDGTAPYSHHIPTWGISIAFMQNGIIKEGAIYLPVLGELFISYNDKIYFSTNLQNKSNIIFSDLKEFKPKSGKNTSLISITQETTKYNTLNISNPVQSVCCAVFSITQLLQRHYMAYILSKHIKIWDFAAGLVLLKNTNIITNYKDNTVLPLSIDGLCDLSKTGLERWKLKKEAILSLNEKNFEFILKNTTFQD